MGIKTRRARLWRWWALALGLLAGLGLVRSVSAHAELLAAEPPPGAQLAGSPSIVRLTFNEPIDTSSRLTLRQRDFSLVAGVTSRLAPDGPNRLLAQLPVLAPGTYTVEYTVVSLDGHSLSGAYDFSVGAAATPTGDAAWRWLLLAGGAALLLVGWGVARRRTGRAT